MKSGPQKEYIPLQAGTIAATIYLRYHYGVDVLAGFIGCRIWCVWSFDVANLVGPTIRYVHSSIWAAQNLSTTITTKSFPVRVVVRGAP